MEENLIKPSRLIAFQHLRKTFVRHGRFPLGNRPFFCMKCCLFLFQQNNFKFELRQYKHGQSKKCHP